MKEIKTINLELLDKKEQNILISRINDVVSTYGLIFNELVFVINKRLKTTAGRIRYKKNENPINNVEISLAYKYYSEFGFDRIMKTLNHELAHLITLIKHNVCGHNKLFYNYCKELGGSTKYNNSEYIQTKKKWHYECLGCGESFDRSTKVKKFNICCAKCRTNITNFKVKKIKDI